MNSPYPVDPVDPVRTSPLPIQSSEEPDVRLFATLHGSALNGTWISTFFEPEIRLTGRFALPCNAPWQRLEQAREGEAPRQM